MRKAISIFTLAIFATFMFATLASAIITISGNTDGLSQAEGTRTIELTISSTKNETVSISIEDLKDDDSDYILFELSQDSVVLDESNNNTAEITLTYTIQNAFDFEFGKEYSTKLKLNGTESNNKEKEVSFKETDFCEDINEDAGLEVKLDDFSVEFGFGDEDDYWYLRDEIKIDVELNDPSYDIEDIDLEWELYTTSGMRIDDGEESVSDIDENDDDKITFAIKLDEDIDEFSGEDAVLYVRAVGKIDDSGSKDGDKFCSSDYKNVDVNIDDDFVITDEIKINSQSVDYQVEASCGKEITLSGEVWNIGSDDQDDLYIEIYSKALEVNKRFEYEEIESFEDEEFSYTFSIPEGIEEGLYKLTIEVFDEDNDIYESKEDDESKRTIQFKVAGNCKIEKPSIYAELETEAKENKEIIIKSTIRNNEDSKQTFTVLAEGYEEWAKLLDVTPQVVSLESGETKDVTIRLKANKDSAGEKYFNIKANSNGKGDVSQPVLVSIQEGSFDIKDYMTKENLQVGGIVLLNLILLVAIILVARKILKRK